MKLSKNIASFRRVPHNHAVAVGYADGSRSKLLTNVEASPKMSSAARHLHGSTYLEAVNRHRRCIFSWWPRRYSNTQLPWHQVQKTTAISRFRSNIVLKPDVIRRWSSYSCPSQKGPSCSGLCHPTRAGAVAYSYMTSDVRFCKGVITRRYRTITQLMKSFIKGARTCWIFGIQRGSALA